MENRTHTLRYLMKSKFVRSISLQVLSIFLIVAIAIIAIVFYSFSSEISRNIIDGRQRQLAVIEETISKRMDEITSIAFNVGSDPAFYMEPVADDKYSGYEMSNTLSKYLIGNSFIEHLAYYRLSEPDKIYTARGELSFSGFWSTYMGLDKETSAQYIRAIQATRNVNVHMFSFGDSAHAFFAYTCPLPQFSRNPQAFVLILIPVSEVAPLLETQLVNSRGVVAVFDADGNEIYRLSTLDDDLAVNPSFGGDGSKTDYITISGSKYVVQKQVSNTNGWTYVSIVRRMDIVSGLAGRQLLFIILLLVLMLVAIFAILIGIVVQFKPISSLATTVSDGERGDDKVIDERALLTNTIATLQDDSEQKQHFETAYHEAEAANKAKSAFLSSMSHDIRTPMNAIIGMTAFAYQHADDPEYVRDCLTKVEVASKYLLDIINNVLDMSRIESGRFTLTEEPVELPGFIHELVTILAPSVEAKNQKLIVEAEMIQNEQIIGDSVRLTQVFMNILSNAVKFTPDGGVICLHVREAASTVAGRGDYVFTISDTGIGMSPAFVGHVFDTFARSSDADVTKVEGTGLGMAIAKSLVELMGGDIRCESALGKGTTFTVSLHFKLAEAANAAPELAPGQPAVLIVGGGERLRRNEMQVFESVGATVDYAFNAADAARMADASLQSGGQPYRLVLIHASDADKSGFAAAAAIRYAAGAADTACVLATASISDLRQAEAHKAGIDALVQLPLFRSSALRLLSSRFDTPGGAPQPHAAIPDLTGRRVLIAEDNPINREIARKILHETNAQIEEAADGREALEQFEARAPFYFDLILMDLQMPVMNGYEAAAAIRALPRTDASSVPIYALTASTFDEDVRQVRESGMNGHIGKPYTAEVLYDVLARVIQH